MSEAKSAYILVICLKKILDSETELSAYLHSKKLGFFNFNQKLAYDVL